MWKVLSVGIGAACAITIITFALHLLNRASDAAVASGYLILLGLIAVAVGLIQNYRRRNW